MGGAPATTPTHTPDLAGTHYFSSKTAEILPKATSRLKAWNTHRNRALELPPEAERTAGGTTLTPLGLPPPVPGHYRHLMQPWYRTPEEQPECPQPTQQDHERDHPITAALEGAREELPRDTPHPPTRQGLTIEEDQATGPRRRRRRATTRMNGEADLVGLRRVTIWEDRCAAPRRRRRASREDSLALLPIAFRAESQLRWGARLGDGLWG